MRTDMVQGDKGETGRWWMEEEKDNMEEQHKQ